MDFFCPSCGSRNCPYAVPALITYPYRQPTAHSGPVWSAPIRGSVDNKHDGGHEYHEHHHHYFDGYGPNFHPGLMDFQPGHASRSQPKPRAVMSTAKLRSPEEVRRDEEQRARQGPAGSQWERFGSQSAIKPADPKPYDKFLMRRIDGTSQEVQHRFLEQVKGHWVQEGSKLVFIRTD